MPASDRVPVMFSCYDGIGAVTDCGFGLVGGRALDALLQRPADALQHLVDGVRRPSGQM